MRKYKLVADSSADMLETSTLSVAPLKIITDQKEYIDNDSLDVTAMVNDLLKYKGRSGTSCPSPEDWLLAFGDADEIFCITITATLSGSYNSASIAKELYEEKFPDKKVFVLNSLTTGPEMRLILEKADELFKTDKPFEEIITELTEYSETTELLFMLESMRNLANNGRVSHLSAKAAGLLGIRVIGRASDKGDLEPLDKCRGQAKAVETYYNRMKFLGWTGGKVRIAHCINPEAAQTLKKLIIAEYPDTDIQISESRGLCSFYAEKGGMLVGFETSK